MLRICNKTLIFLSFILFLATTPKLVLAAESCGENNTDNKCGEWGGCEELSRCEITYGWLWSVKDTSCNSDPTCINVDQSQNNCGKLWTRDECGPDNGCQYGYMCSEVANDQWACVPPTNPNGLDCTAPPAIIDPGSSNPPTSQVPNCGFITSNSLLACGCDAAVGGSELHKLTNFSGDYYCCGLILNGNSCYGSQTEYDAALAASTGSSDGSGGNNNDNADETPDPTPPDIFAGPTSENFNTLNPLKNFSDGSAGLTSPGAIVSRLLQFAFPLAGLILFAELVWGGFEMLIGATGKGIEAGKQRVTNALIGFILLFVAYWIFQIVEVIFGVVIL